MRDEPANEEKIRELTARLEEAEETLRAVRSGEIDAFIVQGPEGDRVYTLRSAEQPYRNLVEDMLEGAAILTTDGDIAYCNKRFAELVEVPLEEVAGGAMERFINIVDRPAYRSMLAEGSGKRRTQLICADGHAVDVFLSFTTSMCDDVERRNLIITDLSELLDAQTGRDRAEQQSHAKDEFMAMLAHELRNPLSAITAAVQVLEAANAHQTATTRARFIIGRQVQHLSRLVDDLLDVGRVVTGKIVLDKRALDLGDLVRRTAVVFTERGTHHHFTIDTGSDRETETDEAARTGTGPVWIEGDCLRMEQIVSNIIGNAVKYTPEGGHIRVRLSVEADEAVLRVQDDGFGIAPELLPRIFDLFVQGERTLDRAQGGLGIGLTLVRRLVNLHRGAVSVASDGPNRGSTFTVRLPRIVVRRPIGACAELSACANAGANTDVNAESGADARAHASVGTTSTSAKADANSSTQAGDGAEDDAGSAAGGKARVRADSSMVPRTDPASAAPSGDSGRRSVPTAGRRVLIVEDNRDAREMLRMMLELNGHEILEAHDGHTGLKILATAAPDIALIDVGLPGLDGYEIARRYRTGLSGARACAGAGGFAANPSDKAGSGSGGTQVGGGGDFNHRALLVALTGYGTPDAIERSHRAGFDHHLIKPVNPEALYKLLNSDSSTLKIAAPKRALYNERLSWCGAEQSGGSPGS